MADLSSGGFGKLVQKAFYLGVGLAAYAGEKAGGTFAELKDQAQKLVNELVERGEITAEEAQQMVNEMVNRAQAAAPPPAPPRQIEILDDDSDPTSSDLATRQAEERQAEALRRQVEALKAELRRLQN